MPDDTLAPGAMEVARRVNDELLMYGDDDDNDKTLARIVSDVYGPREKIAREALQKIEDAGCDGCAEVAMRALAKLDKLEPT